MRRTTKLRAGAAGVILGLTGVVATAPAADATSVDLAGLWLFNEKSGQRAYDMSFSGNPGQLGSTDSVDDNDPTRFRLPSWWFPRGALSFDGNDFVKVQDSPSLEPDGVTVIARVRASSPGNFRYVVAKGALECETASYGLYTGGDGGLRFYVSDGEDYVLSADAGPGVWDGRWHTVIGGFDGTQLRLWVDGQRVGEPTPTDLTIRYGLPTDDNLYIGTYAGPCTNIIEPGFQGDMDGVALIGRYAGSSLGGVVD